MDGHTDRRTFGYYVLLYVCMHTAGEEKVEGQEDTLSAQSKVCRRATRTSPTSGLCVPIIY